MRIVLLLIITLLLGCKSAEIKNKVDKSSSSVENWVSLFNGKDLTGWTAKFRGHPYGENYNNTFQVKDGNIVVSYDEYVKFDNDYGHLFYEKPFSHYRIKLEYKIYGEQTSGGAGWAYKNSGLMYHCQEPSTMKIEQPFPICLEGQFLGGNGKDERSTMNLCTPATHVTINNVFTKDHCITSTSKTFSDPDYWVEVEFIVNGAEDIYHLVEGDTVFHFTNPIYGGDDFSHLVEIKEGDLVKGGYLALQAESHPIAFRNIRILDLTE
jgi:hypothetical protein